MSAFLPAQNNPWLLAHSTCSLNGFFSLGSTRTKMATAVRIRGVSSSGTVGPPTACEPKAQTYLFPNCLRQISVSMPIYLRTWRCPENPPGILGSELGQHLRVSEADTMCNWERRLLFALPWLYMEKKRRKKRLQICKTPHPPSFQVQCPWQ